jgi:hypothetical protein
MRTAAWLVMAVMTNPSCRGACGPPALRGRGEAAGGRRQRLALQNAASIAALVLTTDCMIANAPQPPAAAGPGMPGGLAPEY